MHDPPGSRTSGERPLTAGPWAVKEPLCPEDLMLGRTRVGIPTAQFKTEQQLVKRFRVVQEAKEEFWDKWVKEVFPSLLIQKNWFKYKRDAKAGRPRTDMPCSVEASFLFTAGFELPTFGLGRKDVTSTPAIAPIQHPKTYMNVVFAQ